jgi:cobalamin-dependent methionine synthase I
MDTFNLYTIDNKINSINKTISNFIQTEKYDRIVDLAKEQHKGGARCININIGNHPAERLQDLVQALQTVLPLPISIDSTDLDQQQLFLQHYDAAKANKKKPFVNSISEGRLEFIHLSDIQPLRFIVLSSEQEGNQGVQSNTTAEEIADTAKRMTDMLMQNSEELSLEDIYLDPGLHPLSNDIEGALPRTLKALELMHRDNDLNKAHKIVTLSNLTSELPAKTASGNAVKTPLQCAFLTLAVPRGLDTIIADSGKAYRPLPNSHEAMKVLWDLMILQGVDAFDRLQRFYQT